MPRYHLRRLLALCVAGCSSAPTATVPDQVPDMVDVTIECIKRVGLANSVFEDCELLAWGRVPIGKNSSVQISPPIGTEDSDLHSCEDARRSPMRASNGVIWWCDEDGSHLVGADLEVGSSVFSGAMSGIDLVAPSGVTFFGEKPQSGTILTGGNIFTGTSGAAPHVAGAAILVKHWGRDNGHTWVNSPGRLHAFMLAMTDRDRDGSRVTNGSDDRWGFGKFKMRLFESSNYLSPWGFSMRTNTQTNTGTETIVPFSYTMPTGTEIVKCVMHEHEYMTTKDDVGDTYFRVRVVPSVGGVCQSSSTNYFTRNDFSYDLKHLGRNRE